MSKSQPMTVTSHDKRDFADMIKLRVLRWGVILDNSGECSVISKEAGRSVREKRFDDGSRNESKCHCEDGVTSQGM